MTNDQNERLVVAYESIGKALEGIHEEVKGAGRRYWPKPGEQRESVLTRVPNEEDEARRNLGISDGPIEDWLNLEDTECIGERSAQWLRDHPKDKAKKPSSSPETISVGEHDDLISVEIDDTSGRIEDAKSEPVEEVVEGKGQAAGIKQKRKR